MFIFYVCVSIVIDIVQKIWLCHKYDIFRTTLLNFVFLILRLISLEDENQHKESSSFKSKFRFFF